MALERYSRIAKKLPQALLAAAQSGFSWGYCQICERRTGFFPEQPWHREYYRCVRCFSSSRMRSFMNVLSAEFPDWKNICIHESSPSGPVADRLRKSCAAYTASQYFPGVELGSVFKGKQCQNLEKLTFADASFDLFITQDVMEHVLNPFSAFKEIARVLKPGGAHLFTVPWLKSRVTDFRAVPEQQQIQYLKEPEYHGNPIDPDGSLVVTDWGYDMENMIYQHSGMSTKRFLPQDSALGIVGECLDVFISYKHP